MAPVCQSCAMIRPSAACTALVTRRHPRTCSAFQETRRVGPAEAVGTDRGGFGDDQAGRGALGIVFGLQRCRHVVDRPGAHARQRRHDDPVGQVEIAHADRGEKGLEGHAGLLTPGFSGR